MKLNSTKGMRGTFRGAKQTNKQKCYILRAHQLPMQTESTSACQLATRLLPLTQRHRSCKNYKLSSMSTKFCVKDTEPLMEDSMQENGIERKMFTG